MMLSISFLVPSAVAFFVSSSLSPPPLRGTLLPASLKNRPRHSWTIQSPHYIQQRQRLTRYATISDRHSGTQQQQEEEDVVIDKFLASFQQAWRHPSSGEHNDKEEDDLRHYFVEEEEESNRSCCRRRPFWRDMVAYTWNIVTLEGMDSIMDALHQPAIRDYRSRSTFQRTHQPLPPRKYSSVIPPSENKDSSSPHVGPSSPSSPQLQEDEVMEFWADLTIDNVGTGKVHFKLVRTSSHHEDAPPLLSFKIHTLLTTLMELSDRPFRVGAHRTRGHEPSAVRERKYWSEQQQGRPRHSPTPLQHEDPVVIIGGGQAGLSLGARLHLLDIPYIILEAGEKPGMAWRKRYPSLHLHDPVWYNHMPYLPFPETWPVFCPRDKIADWLEFYATALDLNVHTRCKVTQVEPLQTHDGSETTRHAWNVMVSYQGNEEEDTSSRNIVAQHVVFATGNSSKPRIPSIPGVFRGLQIHSSHYRGGRNFRGKRVVVVGSNNSGWDIVQGRYPIIIESFVPKSLSTMRQSYNGCTTKNHSC